MPIRRQADYSSDRRPIVLNVLENYSVNNAEVIPTIISPSPVLWEVLDQDVETQFNEFPVLLPVHTIEQELFSMIQSSYSGSPSALEATTITRPRYLISFSSCAR